MSRDEEIIEMTTPLQDGITITEEVEEIWRPEDFKKRECNTFIEDKDYSYRPIVLDEPFDNRPRKCQCGRHRDTHPTHIDTAALQLCRPPTDAALQLCRPPTDAALQLCCPPTVAALQLCRPPTDAALQLCRPPTDAALQSDDAALQLCCPTTDAALQLCCPTTDAAVQLCCPPTDAALQLCCPTTDAAVQLCRPPTDAALQLGCPPTDAALQLCRPPTDAEWTSELHSSELPTDAFGELKVEGRLREAYPTPFLRLSSDTKPSVVYDMMTRKRNQDGWGLNQPILVVSVVGGEGSAEVKTWVQEVIREGLVKALDNTGVSTWILTDGFDEGVGRCVGEALRDIGNPEMVRAVGITPWGFVHNRHQLVNSQGSDYVQYSVENTTSDSCCLEKNHCCFLLVDNGSEGHRGGEKNFRVKLEEHFSTRHIRDNINIPALNMLIGGELSMLERVGVSLKNSTPWLVLAGSGGVADLLSDILENQPPASDGVDADRVTELIRKHFPSEAQTDELVEQVQTIYQNRKLITFYHEEERPEYFDTVMIKALMPASKHRASGNTFPFGKELCLAMLWNRVDFANSELFNDVFNINWTDEVLKDCMMFALLSKPQFVHLFIKKNILTYGLLEKLYSRVDKDTLIYKLLLERLEERLGTSHLDSLEEISLFEVSRVLKKLMGEEKPFYFTVLGLEDSGKKALEPVRELLKGECSYRNKPCESPWTHLFILAVLQNRSDMANFIWEKAEEPVLNALSACKMLREMSKLEIETDTKHSELALKFETRARGVFGSCYQSDEGLSFELLNRESPVWNTDCFQIITVVESGLFLSHDGIQSMLSRVWWGDMKRDTTLWKVLLTIFCPLLLYTNLISYREPDKSKESKPSVVSRWRQFWSAPVTSFLGNALMYIPFLFLFAYVLLVDFKPPPSGPSISEYVLYFWVFTFFCEEIYEAFFMRDITSRQRMKLYMQDVWNMYDLTAIILFIIGLICRMFEWSYDFGRCVLCIGYMVFTLRLIHIFAVHKQMGPTIIIVGKMMKEVFSFFFFLGVWIVAYGVANQALLYSYDPNPERIFRRVFYRPYLYIFGHFPVEEVDVGLHWDMADNCTDNVTQIEGGAEPCRSEYNNWLVIILLGVFLLVTNILLINLLIAMLTKTFEKVQDKSDLHWKFQHYNLIMEYKSRPVLAPPFIILSHLHIFISFLMKKIHRESPSTPNMPKTYDKWWETEQKYIFLAEEPEKSSDSERIKLISDKLDLVDVKQDKSEKRTAWMIELLNDMVDRMDRMVQRQIALETKMENHSDALGQILDILAKAPWPKDQRTKPWSRGEFGAAPECEYNTEIVSECVFSPTAVEQSQRLFHLRYSCSQDRYVRVSNDNEEVQGWERGVWRQESVFRKVESDWQMVYLARTEGSSTGSIIWKMDFSPAGMKVGSVSVRASCQTFHSGKVTWCLRAGSTLTEFSADGRTHTFSGLSGSPELLIEARLSGGEGESSWQHAQLFRQSLKETSPPAEPSFEVLVHLEDA